MRPFGYFIAASLLSAASAHAADLLPGQAEQTVTIKLPVADWNIVLQGLGELPLKTSYGVLQNIQAQSAPQLKPPVPEPLKKVPKP